MPKDLELTGQSLSLADVVSVARDSAVAVSAARPALDALARSRQLVEEAVARGETIYGINTGFGKLATIRVSANQLDQLQLNLIRSHAAGVGDPLPREIVRATMLLRANVLLRPTSGVRPALVEALIALLWSDEVNKNVLDHSPIAALGFALAVLSAWKPWKRETEVRAKFDRNLTDNLV